MNNKVHEVEIRIVHPCPWIMCENPETPCKKCKWYMKEKDGTNARVH